MGLWVAGWLGACVRAYVRACVCTYVCVCAHVCACVHVQRSQPYRWSSKDPTSVGSIPLGKWWTQWWEVPFLLATVSTAPKE